MKKYQIFISSTYIDMIDERQEAVQTILENQHIPAGMELFSAQNVEQWNVIKKWIDRSDIIVLLLGNRYGSIDKKSKISYTQMEYEYAVKKNKPIIVLNFTEKYNLKKGSVSSCDNSEMLSKFRNNVLSKLVKFIDDFSEIKPTILNGISDIENNGDIYLTGWVRADQKTIDSKYKIGQISLNEMKTILESKKVNISFLIEGETRNALILFEKLIIPNGGEFYSSTGGDNGEKIYHKIVPIYISLGLMEIVNIPKVRYKKSRLTKDGIKFVQLLEKTNLYSGNDD